MEKEFLNIVYDTDFTKFVPNWWYVHIEIKQKEQKKQKKSFFDNILEMLWISNVKKKKKTNKTTNNKNNEQKSQKNKILEKKNLKEQVEYLLSLPDDEYSDKMLTSELRKYIQETEKKHNSLLNDYKSHIAPSYRKVDWWKVNISWMYAKTYYIESYPSFIQALWVQDILWINVKRDIWFFLYKEDNAWIQFHLRQKSTQLRAEINEARRKWQTVDVDLEIKYRDVEIIRQKLATHEEEYFEIWTYITIYNEDLQKLSDDCKKIEQALSGLWIRAKQAIQRMDEGFISTLPLCIDQLWITRSAVTTSLAGSFPFISWDLFSDTWILYWLNLLTWWLIVFDRFNSTLPNMNSIVLATSWAWKSFTVKLEIIRYLINWIKIMVMDPENEYKSLCEKLWWTYINISTNSEQHINPFDLPPKLSDREYWKWDLLRSKIMDLIWLIKILVNNLDAAEEALLDKALQITYQLKWITFEEDDYEWKEIPTMQDLYNVLDWMDWWESLALKLSKYVTWTFAKIFNNPTNVNLNNDFTVFSIRDLEDTLKTPAMYNVLNYMWTQVRAKKEKRMIVCDEAWILLQNEISANFLFWLIKRARKYWVGITTISQDIEDFMKSPYWKPIVSNSPFKILLKQSTVSIQTLENLLWLSEAEKNILVWAWIWEWLIFAWQQHCAVKILASSQEKEFLDTTVK